LATGTICGTSSPSQAQPKPHSSITVINPAQIPKISGQHFRMPYRLVLLNSRMLLGPGEKVVAQAYAASCK